MKRIAIIFSLFILAVIIAADLNILPAFIRVFYNFQGGDKVGHFILFGVLSFFVNASLLLQVKPMRNQARMVITSTLVLFVLISFEEWTQAFIPSRTFDLVDLFASLTGVVIGAILAASIAAKFIKTTSK